MRRLVLLIAVAAVASACADDGPAGGGSEDETVYRVDAFVLEDASHGPELCVGGVADSLPPQCGGVPLVGWDWDDVDDEDAHGGARWGQFDVTGTYDGERLTVLTAGPPRDEGLRTEEPIEWTRCPEPAEGWTSSSPERTSEGDLVAAMHAAEAEHDFAGFWIDAGAGIGGVDIVNAAFTGDLEAHATAIREIWGGPVCMVAFERTEAELRRIQRELSDPAVAAGLGIETTWSATDVTSNVVEQGVVVATDAARAAIAERYGEGTVELFPSLVPIDGEP